MAPQKKSSLWKRFALVNDVFHIENMDIKLQYNWFRTKTTEQININSNYKDTFSLPNQTPFLNKQTNKINTHKNST